MARLLALFLVALTLLAWEVFLTRLLSYAVNTLLVYLALGVALTGLGAAGSLVARRATRPTPPPAGAVEAPPADAAAAQGQPVASSPDGDALELAALALQVLLPLSTFAFLRLAPHLVSWPVATPAAALLLVLPFACGGVVLTLLLTQSHRQIGRAYAVDLAGSALGCWLPLVALRPLGGPAFALLLCLLAGTVTVALWSSRGSLERRARRWVPATAVGLAVVTALVHRPAFHTWPEPDGQVGMIARHAAENGYQIRRQHSWWNPVGRVEIYSFRVPGAPEPYPYAFYAQDGTAGAIVAQWDGAEGGVVPAMCRDTLFGQGYLAPRERVLVIGVGGGADVQCALVHGARHIDAVDINPDSIAALQGPLLEFTGGIGRAPAVHWHLQDGRAFVQAAPAGQYDQVQLSGVDTKQILASGSLALNENRLYTAEAFRDYLRMLRPGGMLSVIYFTEAATLRLAYTVTEALRELGAEHPERHLMVLRNAHVYGVLATREPLDAATLRAFRERWAPGKPFQGMHAVFLDTFGHETTQRPDHVLDPDRASDPVFALFREAVATRRLPEFAALYPLAVEPVTDDRPFFFDFAKSGSLAGAPHRALLGGLLLWVLLTAAVFIFLPLGRLRAAAGSGGVLAVAPYFAGLGLGFMLIEIWLIHTFAPLLGHQVLSMAVVLGGLLASTGVGAFFFTDRLARRGAWVPVLLLAVLCLALAVGAPRLIQPFLGAATAARVAVVLVVVAPAGLLMGTLLPAGLSRQVDPAVRAWGLAINFFFSVLGTVAAVPLVMAWGYGALVPLGLAVYLAAAVADGLARRGSTAAVG